MRKDSVGSLVALIGALALVVAGAWGAWLLHPTGYGDYVDLATVGPWSSELHGAVRVFGRATSLVGIVAAILAVPAVVSRGFALCATALALTVAELAIGVTFVVMLPAGAAGPAFSLFLFAVALVGTGVALVSNPLHTPGRTDREVERDDDGRPHGRALVYDERGRLLQVETWAHGERIAVVEYDGHGQRRPTTSAGASAGVAAATAPVVDGPAADPDPPAPAPGPAPGPDDAS